MRTSCRYARVLTLPLLLQRALHDLQNCVGVDTAHGTRGSRATGATGGARDQRRGGGASVPRAAGLERAPGAPHAAHRADYRRQPTGRRAHADTYLSLESRGVDERELVVG